MGETSKKKGGLSSAVSAGIGTDVAVGAVALLGLAFFLWRRRRQKGKGFVGSSSSKPEEGDRGENVNVAELHGKHLSELSNARDWVFSGQRWDMGKSSRGLNFHDVLLEGNIVGVKLPTYLIVVVKISYGMICGWSLGRA